jgi:hypothetical protein
MPVRLWRPRGKKSCVGDMWLKIDSDYAEVDIGANASAESADGEGVEDGYETVNNVIYSFRLKSTAFEKRNFLIYLKSMLFLTLHNSVVLVDFHRSIVSDDGVSYGQHT